MNEATPDTQETEAAALPQLDASELVDAVELERAVKEIYRAVAELARAELHFTTGRALAEQLGYDASVLDRVPAEALDSFAGVGFHHDLGAPRPGESVLDLGCGSGTDVFYS